jgi:cDNA FLJ60964, weakly similar to homo sapiens dentin sialophosphoprotein (DSPP), mRNA
MANVYTTHQAQKSIIKKLIERYYALESSSKIFAQNATNANSPDYQKAMEQQIEYNNKRKTPYIASIKDLQNAINDMESKFSNNCNCYRVLDECQSCQKQCSTDNGVDLGQCSCQYQSERVNEHRIDYACQSIICQSSMLNRTCENCQTCESCQTTMKPLSCESCQLFDCQTLRCETFMSQCSCQECQTQCTQCSCQSIGKYESCQTQCRT